MMRGLTYSQVAREMGCTRCLVSMTAAGLRGDGPKARAVRARIAELLGRPAHEVWGEIDKLRMASKLTGDTSA